MNLSIVLRKEVPDEATGQAIFAIVKERLADKPDINVSGTVSSSLTIPEEPE